jgi:CHAD domain-containing protein
MPISLKRCQLLFQKVERDLGKLLSDQNPKSVHGFRTSTRRLQTLVEEILPAQSRNQKKLVKMLLLVRKRAGKVRDVDIQLAMLRSFKMPQEPRKKTQLMHSLIDLREKQEKKLKKSLTKETIREARRRLKRIAKDFDAKAARDPLQVAREILSRVAKSDGAATAAMVHQYRILGKQARYAAELAAKSPQASEFIVQLKRVQDAVGHWHDWLTLTQTAAGRFGDVHESSLVAALHNVTGAKFRQALAALPGLQRAVTESPASGGARKDGKQLKGAAAHPAAGESLSVPSSSVQSSAVPTSASQTPSAA